MTQIIKHPKHKLEVADIFRQYIHEYRQAYPLLPEHKKIVSSLINCRTAYLGGHIEQCDTCGTKRISYHSCRNRHCPKCQQIPRERWIEARKQELLPVNYFHVIFTLPHELNTIILNNKSIMFSLLFKAVSRTLLTFGKKELGGKLGFISVLHTWDQKLNAHFLFYTPGIKSSMPIFTCIVSSPAASYQKTATAGSHAKKTTCLTRRPCRWSSAVSSFIT
jgi:hypothetical protein